MVVSVFCMLMANQKMEESARTLGLKLQIVADHYVDARNQNTVL